MAKLPIPASVRAAGAHVLFPAVAVPGAIGGISSLVVLYPLPANHYFDNLNNLVIGIPLALLLGAVAALITIVVFTNTDRQDVPRMVVLGFVAGFAFQSVLARAVQETVNGAPIDLDGVVDAALGEGDSPDVDITEDAKKVDPEFQEPFARVSASQTLLDTLRSVAELRGDELNTYLEEQAALPEFLSALTYLGEEQLVELNSGGRVQLTDRGQTLVGYLDEAGEEGALPQRDALADAVPLALNESWSDGFDEYADNWYSVAIPASGDYVFRTSGSNVEPTDTVITLYEENGVTERGSDDDGDEWWPYSKLNESLEQGTYYLKVSSFYSEPGDYTVIVQSGENVLYAQSSEVVAVMDLAGATLLPGASLSAFIERGASVHFRFTVGADERGDYRFSTTGDDGLLDTTMSLFRADPISPSEAGGDERARRGELLRLVEIGFDDDGGSPSLYSELTETLDPGTYYLRIEALWDGSGDFAVRAERVDLSAARN